MLGLGIFKRKQSKNSNEAFKKVRPKIAVSQDRVLRAIQQTQPAHYRTISEHLNIIEGSVTPRIAELRRKELVKVAFVKKGSSGSKVNHYALTGLGMKTLIAAKGAEQ